jgi:hypothetical protein
VKILSRSFPPVLVTLSLVTAAMLLGNIASEVSSSAGQVSRMIVAEYPRLSPGGAYPPGIKVDIEPGDGVVMLCWTTGPSNLGSSKWFKIYDAAVPNVAGYVPANSVTNQTKVGFC